MIRKNENHTNISEHKRKFYLLTIGQEMSILPYERTPDESSGPMNADNMETWKMLTTRYVPNALESSTDNAKLEIDTNHVSPWLRYTAFTPLQDADYTTLFGKESVKWMSAQITLRLKGVHPEGKEIIVPDSSILSVADSFYRGTQLSIEMLREMIILHIVSQVTNDFQQLQQNDALSAWQTLYSMDTSLQRHSSTESWIRQKRRTHFYHTFY